MNIPSATQLYIFYYFFLGNEWQGVGQRVGKGGRREEVRSGVSSWPVNVIGVHFQETSLIFQYSVVNKLLIILLI
jgi:hypothetical protein